eukprot:3039328-Amphidinium_carterae.1
MVAVGHGLTGVWPQVGSTFNLLSMWGNRLEGHLPNLRMQSYGSIFVHRNLLSCKLPRHEGTASEIETKCPE